VNAKCDVVMKLSVFGSRTDTQTRQNLYILATRAVIRIGKLKNCRATVSRMNHHKQKITLTKYIHVEYILQRRDRTAY